MADKALGKLLAKSKSIRRNRKGSVGGQSNSNLSIGSDDTASISRGVSSLSRFSRHSRSVSRARSTTQSDAHLGAAWPESDDGHDGHDGHSIVIHVPDGKEDEEATSLVSYDSDDVDADL